MSIQALNQADLQQIGQILPRLPAWPDSRCIQHTVLREERLHPWCTTGPTVLEYASGMPLLVVFGEGAPQVFYLDRILQLQAGVTYAIAPLGESCSVSQTCLPDNLPEELPPTDAECVDLAVSDLGFDRICTYFDQNIRQEFYFRGEQHRLYELVYLQQGSLHTVINGQDVALRQQELLIIDRNAWHIQFSEEPCRFATITFDLISDLQPLVNRRLTLPKALRPLMSKLLEERSDRHYAHDYAQALMQILLIELLRSPDHVHSPASLPATLQAENQLLDRILQYISRELHHKITLQELAAYSHVSIPYLYKLFENHLGIPPSQFITRLRLEESKLMLRQGSMTISQIAAQLGFSSVQHFSRQFRHCCGCTPSDYIRAEQNRI